MALSRKSKGIVLMVMFVAVALLSWFGLAALFPESNTLRYLPDRVYRIIKILMGADPSSGGLERPDTPWQLIVVKLFSIYILALIVYKGLQKFFYERIVLYFVAFKKQHTVVVGMGDKSLRLLKNLRHQYDETAVVIEQQMEHPHTQTIRQDGHWTVFGDATEPSVLAEAGVKQAGRFICFLDDEQKVMAIAKKLHDYCQQQTLTAPLDAYLQFRHPRIVDLIEQSRLCQQAAGGLKLHFFNVHKMIARQLMQQLALDFAAQWQQGRRLQLLLLGWSDYNQAIVLQALRVLHLFESQQVSICVYSRDAVHDAAIFRDAYPQAHHIVDVEFIPFHGVLHAICERSAAPHTDTVIVCGEDEGERNINLALALLTRTREQTFVYTLLTHCPEFKHILTQQGAQQRLRFFGSLEDFCRLELITGHQQDRLARAIHADYLALTSGAASESAAYTTAWDALSEDAKDANRAQADHIVFKLALTGQLAALQQQQTLTFSDAEIEALAITEHNRWMAHRYLNGWQFGRERDDDAKHHPSLVAWADLSASEQQKDRDTIVRIPQLLQCWRDVDL